MENFLSENKISAEGNLSQNRLPFKFSRKKVFLSVGAVVALSIVYFFAFSAPANFPAEKIIIVDEGMSLRGVSLKLEGEHVIRSRIAFEAFLILYSGDRHVVSSDYFLEKELPVFEIARRLSKGESHIAPMKIVIPEGFSRTDMAGTFSGSLPNFDKNKFLAESKEGYLFPDTYFFLTRADETDVIKSMSDNFEKKLESLQSEITARGKSEKDIITMASIIEREAKGNDRWIISGILWKRLSIGMALEVDAAPETYKSRGLPKSPICSPGLESIKASIHPESSPYLFYLHDSAGNVHYARNFTEHKANKSKYLK